MYNRIKSTTVGVDDHFEVRHLLKVKENFNQPTSYCNFVYLDSKRYNGESYS